MKALLPSAAHRLLIPTAFALLFAMNTHAAAEKTLAWIKVMRRAGQ